MNLYDHLHCQQRAVAVHVPKLARLMLMVAKQLKTRFGVCRMSLESKGCVTYRWNWVLLDRSAPFRCPAIVSFIYFAAQ